MGIEYFATLTPCLDQHAIHDILEKLARIDGLEGTRKTAQTLALSKTSDAAAKERVTISLKAHEVYRVFHALRRVGRDEIVRLIQHLLHQAGTECDLLGL